MSRQMKKHVLTTETVHWSGSLSKLDEHVNVRDAEIIDTYIERNESGDLIVSVLTEHKEPLDKDTAYDAFIEAHRQDEQDEKIRAVCDLIADMFGGVRSEDIKKILEAK